MAIYMLDIQDEPENVVLWSDSQAELQVSPVNGYLEG